MFPNDKSLHSLNEMKLVLAEYYVIEMSNVLFYFGVLHMVCVITFSFELFLLCFNIRFTYSSFTEQIYNISMFIIL